MKTFKVKVCRISYSFADIEIQANNQSEAEEKALDDAGEHDFCESDYEYKIENLNSLTDYSIHA